MSLAAAFTWFILSLPVLVMLERWMQRHLQGLILLIVSDDAMSTMIYSLLLWPGVFLHEASHWLMAKVLFVRTRKFSVWPQRLPNGRLRMGYVEVERADPFREALIGAAPLILGSAIIVLIGYSQLSVEMLGAALSTGEIELVLNALAAAYNTVNVFFWVYLVFAIANAMMPSESDRRAWPWIAAGLVVIGIVVYYLNFAELAMRVVTPFFTAVFQLLALAFTITIIIDLLLMPFILLAEAGISKLLGYRINYH